YLTPTPYRGRQNQPGYTRYVVEALAKLRETTPETIAKQTWDNAHRIFKLKEDA
ncbi:hydrolase TatD, partial [Lacticaseibacillus rhamnosus]